MNTRKFVAALTLLVACGDDDSAPGDAAPVAIDAGIDAGSAIAEPVGPWYACDDAVATGAEVVTVHDKAPVFFSGWDPGQNARLVDATATLPAGPWQKVFLKVDLGCPNGTRCDFWDRGASISLVDDDGAIELARYMTPYRVGMCFVADVTEFQARLSGATTLRAFIDTWVGPGHPQGDGWLVTSQLVFHAGGPPAARTEVIPLWNNQAEDKLVEVGDPAKPIAEQMPPREVTIPVDASKVELRYIVTGHGQGNMDNCAEFCSLSYTTSFGDKQAAYTPWRSDCEMNPVSDQFGTWMYDRAGWCPGAYVAPNVIDITADVSPGETYTFSHTIADTVGGEFINSCRPGAGGETNTCQNCTLGSTCDYDNGNHTSPYARMSVQLVVTH